MTDWNTSDSPDMFDAQIVLQIHFNGNALQMETRIDATNNNSHWSQHNKYFRFDFMLHSASGLGVHVLLNKVIQLRKKETM